MTRIPDPFDTGDHPDLWQELEQAEVDARRHRRAADEAATRRIQQWRQDMERADHHPITVGTFGYLGGSRAACEACKQPWPCEWSRPVSKETT